MVLIMLGGKKMSRSPVVQCPRCRKKYLVTPTTVMFHQSCIVTSWGPKWGGKTECCTKQY